LLAALSSNADEDNIVKLLDQAERFLLLVRSFAGTRSHVGEADSYRLAHDLHEQSQRVSAASRLLDDRVNRHFSSAVFQTEIDDLFAEPDAKGFYDLPGIKFLLFEYEEHLRKVARSAPTKIVWEDFRGARNSIEHIYPQHPEEGEWPMFGKFDVLQKRCMAHS